MDADDRKRARGHVLAIVERLRRGPATNAELSEISLKYTGRISDARKLGHDIRCTKLQGGLTRYELVPAAPVQQQLL